MNLAQLPGVSVGVAGSMRAGAPVGRHEWHYGIALTKLDVLDGLDELKICVGYKLDGQEIDYLPAAQAAQARVEPIYITLEGWKESTVGARKWADLRLRPSNMFVRWKS